jgi:cobalt-zinc-cadmium efflux system membrane fusion protein
MTAEKQGGDRNALNFPADAPQLAYMRIQPVTEVAEPAAEPLPARIAYDENKTARVTTPLAGRVVKIAVQPGDTVKSGQPLAWLDSPDYGSAVTDAAKAEADLRQKQAAYERAQILFNGQVLARKDLESAEADIAQAQAERRRAVLRLRNLSQGANEGAGTGERVALRAPIAGVVAERQINPGAEIRPDTPGPQFVVSDLANLWVMIDLPERYLGKVHVGQRVDLELDAFPNEVFQARVASIGAALDPTSRRVPVRCELPNPGGRLKPEMFARATLIADSQRQVLRVPNSALVMTGLYYFVFVETAPGRLEKRRVDVSIQDRDYSIVKAGLKAGERIVTSGALLINSELSGN